MTIFAKVNVELLTHQRLLRIPKKHRGAALGAWLAALLYSRARELDGFCPTEALETVASPVVLGCLVDVGLLGRDEQDGVHGVRVLRYADHNETKAEIEERRILDRKRKRKFDSARLPTVSGRNDSGKASGRSSDSDRINAESDPDSGRSNAKFPDSDSGSVSGSFSVFSSDPGEIKKTAAATARPSRLIALGGAESSAGMPENLNFQEPKPETET